MKVAPSRRILIRQFLYASVISVFLYLFVMLPAAVGILVLSRADGVLAEEIEAVNAGLPTLRLKVGFVVTVPFLLIGWVVWRIYRGAAWSLTGSGVLIESRRSDPREIPWRRLKGVSIRKGALRLSLDAPSEELSLPFVEERERWKFLLKCEELAVAEAGGCKPPPLG